jgi:chromatin assembly factor 1 subunit B
MTSSDGFCSTLTFGPNELGEVHIPEPVKATPSVSLSSLNTPSQTPAQTPTSSIAPPFPSSNSQNAHHRTPSNPSLTAPSPPPILTTTNHPSSPTRSNSTSSNATNSSSFPVISNPPLVAGNIPPITASASSTVASFVGLSMTTPPQTPRSTASSVTGAPVGGGGLKRGESESQDGEGQPVAKKRRIAPTLVGDLGHGST